MDRAFDRALGGRTGDVMSALMPPLAGPSGAGGHPMDVVETPEAFKLTTDAPGFAPADISVEMHEGVLTIRGQRQQEKVDEKDGKVVRRERTFNSFSRSFTLPDNVKDEGVHAALEKGVLTVTVPKTTPPPKPQPKRIEVVAAGGGAGGGASSA